MSAVSLIIDQGPVYEWIKLNIFGDDVDTWIYNCAAYWGKSSVRFVCRARVLSPQSKVFVSHVITWTTSTDYVLLAAPTKLNIEPISKSVVDDIGPQDARVFAFSEADWIVFNMLSFNGSRQMCLGKLNGSLPLVPLAIMNHPQRHVEKNWTPFVWRGTVLKELLCFLFNISGRSFTFHLFI